MVTVTPHLRHTVGVLLLSENEEKGIFKPLLEAETAAPARRTAVFNTPREGGDVLIKICEGVRDIKVSKKAAAKQAIVTNGSKGGEGGGKDDGGSDLDSDEEEEEEEEVREKVWKVGKVLAEAAIRGVGKGGKVEVTVNLGSDLGVQVTTREVGAKGGVRGVLQRPGENGAAS